MPTFELAYFSGQGHTHLMAEAVAAGIREAGADANLYRVQGEHIEAGRWQDPGGVVDRLRAADGVVLGTPTYMGGVSAQLKAMIDGLGGLWFEQALAGKIAGGFTHSSSPCGEKTATMLYLMTHAAQHGMLWVSNAQLSDRYTGEDTGINHLGAFVGLFGQQDLDMSDDPEVSLDAGEIKTAHGYGRRLVEAAS